MKSNTSMDTRILDVNANGKEIRAKKNSTYDKKCVCLPSQSREYVVCIFTFDRCPYAYQFVVSVVAISTDLRTIAFFLLLGFREVKWPPCFVQLVRPDAASVSLSLV